MLQEKIVLVKRFQIEKKTVIKEYYEFFNYNDDTSWENLELKEKYYNRAKQLDIDSANGLVPDGYLSKSEYENFIHGIFDEKEKTSLPQVHISQEEKDFINERYTLGGIVQDSNNITDEEKSYLKRIGNIVDFSLKTTITGIALGCAGKVVGFPSKLTGVIFKTGLVGLGISLISNLSWKFYQKHLESKA